MRRILTCSVAFSLLFVAACGGRQIQGASSAKYESAVSRADKAFEELDRETNGEKTPVGGESERLIDREKVSEPVSENKVEEKTSPLKAADKKRPGSTETKYPLVRGVPVWLTEPEAEGYEYAAVGSAPIQKTGVPAQKRIAKAQALAEIARMISVSVDNELTAEKTAVSRNNTENSSSRVSSYSRQRAEEMLTYAEEIDSWTDPRSGILYLFVGIKYR